MPPWRWVFLALALVPLSAEATPWQPFTVLALSADNSRLATGGLEGEVLLWNASSGEVLRRWQIASTMPVVGLVFDEGRLGVATLDGLGFAVSETDPNLQEVSFSSPPWASLATAAPLWLTGAPVSGLVVRFQDRLAQGFPDGRIVVRPGEASTETTWQAHESAVTGLAWTEDGTVLYSSAYDGTLARWDVRTGKLLAKL